MKTRCGECKCHALGAWPIVLVEDRPFFVECPIDKSMKMINNFCDKEVCECQKSNQSDQPLE